LAALLIIIKRFKFRFFETVEASGIAMLFWSVSVFLSNFVANKTLTSALAVILPATLIAVYYLFEGKYRGFSWYKSGRAGFSGFITLGIFFFTRVVFALIEIPMISLVGRLDVLLSGVVSFLLFFGVYHLSESI